MTDQNIIPQLKQLLLELKSDGVGPEEVLQIASQINQTASSRFYAEIMLLLDKEEIEKINAEAKNQDEANQMIYDLFKQKTNQEPEEVKKAIIANLADAYLSEYRKQK